LGAVIIFAAIALLGAGTFVNVFRPMILELPGGHEMFNVLQWSLPLFSVTLLLALLTLVYRVIPNTRVFWGAAFAGAIVVTALLILNNYVAFLYVRRVILTRSLYGSVALPLVLMLGLYIFWLYLLIGGIVSYAVQNVHFRNSQAAWSTLPEQTRERLSLVVFLTICRRFRECLPPTSASQLSLMLKVPTQLVNECLGRLEQLKLVIPLMPEASESESDTRYQPGRPLNRITLYDFKTLDDNYGENPLGSSLEHIDPLMARYDSALARIGEDEFFQKSLDQLFAEHPFDESRPPFARFREPKT
jgi:membrane protein